MSGWVHKPRQKPDRYITTPDKCLGHDNYYDRKREVLHGTLHLYRCRFCGYPYELFEKETGLLVEVSN